MNNYYRLRIAPSPTGYPHIGTIYQALFNYAFAKKNKGSFLVRIEDTDRTRFVEDAEAVIFKALDWFGLTEDESPRKDGGCGPYRQSERLEIYHKFAQELVDKERAYFAYYPREQAGVKKDYTSGQQKSVEPTNIQEAPKTVMEMLEKKDWVLRMKVPQTGVMIVKDEIRGEITFDVTQVTEQILLKSDGFPTYHLAVVVDDHLMQISHIVRAEEWISSLPKHKLLYEYFGWQMPPIYHTATLRNPDKSKLSKRHGHTNVNWFKEEGFLPEAVLNFLGLLGWSHPEGKEIFSLEEFIRLFDLKDIRPIAPIFDLVKLRWVNGEYIRKMSIEELTKRLVNFDSCYADDFKPEVLNQLVKLSQTRMETLKDFGSLVWHFSPDFVLETNNEYTKIAQTLENKLSNIATWNSDDIMSSIREILQQYKLKMPILYTIFTGQPKGLPLPESLVILGKEETLKRLSAYV